MKKKNKERGRRGNRQNVRAQINNRRENEKRKYAMGQGRREKKREKG